MRHDILSLYIRGLFSWKRRSRPTQGCTADDDNFLEKHQRMVEPTS